MSMTTRIFALSTVAFAVTRKPRQPPQTQAADAQLLEPRPALYAVVVLIEEI
jgi:hypothetical protein